MYIDKRKSNGVKKFYIFFALIMFFIFVFQVLPIYAGTSVDAKFIDGLKKTGGAEGAGYPVAAIEKNPGGFIARIFGSALTPMFMGVIAMLLFFYGGYTLMMARGNEEQVEKAKTILVNTAIAMIVAFSAYAIVNLIIPLWAFVTK